MPLTERYYKMIADTQADKQTKIRTTKIRSVEHKHRLSEGSSLLVQEMQLLRESVIYQQEFAALLGLTDNTERIVLSGTIEDKKKQLLKELGTVSVVHRKARS